jgi:hypothetical protein
MWEDAGTGDLETDLFKTYTDHFIVYYEILQPQKYRALPSFQATVEDEDGRSNSSGKRSRPRSPEIPHA